MIGEHVASAPYCKAAHLLAPATDVTWVNRCHSNNSVTCVIYPDMQACPSLGSNHLPFSITHIKAYLCHQTGEGDCANGSGFSNPNSYHWLLVSKGIWHLLMGFLEFCPIAMYKPEGLK